MLRPRHAAAHRRPAPHLHRPRAAAVARLRSGMAGIRLLHRPPPARQEPRGCGAATRPPRSRRRAAYARQVKGRPLACIWQPLLIARSRSAASHGKRNLTRPPATSATCVCVSDQRRAQPVSGQADVSYRRTLMWAALIRRSRPSGSCTRINGTRPVRRSPIARSISSNGVSHLQLVAVDEADHRFDLPCHDADPIRGEEVERKSFQ
jgi:hypothetical protein